jgi:hypothetical protein
MTSTNPRGNPTGMFVWYIDPITHKGYNVPLRGDEDGNLVLSLSGAQLNIDTSNIDLDFTALEALVGAVSNPASGTVNKQLSTLLTQSDFDSKMTSLQSALPSSPPSISGLLTLVDFDAKVGEVQANPTANTVLDRLKVINTSLGGTIKTQEQNPISISTLLTTTDFDNKIGEVQASPTANTLLDRLKTIATALSNNFTTTDFDNRIGEVQASPTANTVLDRLKAIATALGGTVKTQEQSPLTGFATSANQTTSNTALGHLTDNTQTTGIVPPTAITAGVKTVTTGGTAVKLLASTTACKYVTISALVSNTGTVYVGGSTVLASTKTGLPLTNPADGSGIKVPATTVVPIDDVSKIYIDATVNGEGVSFSYMS